MPATLQLELTDAAGNDLNDLVRIELLSTQSSERFDIRRLVQRGIKVNVDQAAQRRVYRLVVTPSNYRLVQLFQTLDDGQTANLTLRFPVDPKRVAGIHAPGHAQLHPRLRSILEQSETPRFIDAGGGFLQGETLYNALDAEPRRKACLLNIAVKSEATVLRDGSSCLDHFGGMIRMEQDRIFFRTTAALLEEVQNSPLFGPASAALHDSIPGYEVRDSYKTLDKYGNLQLTFQRGGAAGNDYVADVDIDDAQGIEHIFQVLRNSITGGTNPYDIHDILLRQTPPLDPRYTFAFPLA